MTVSLLRHLKEVVLQDTQMAVNLTSSTTTAESSFDAEVIAATASAASVTDHSGLPDSVWWLIVIGCVTGVLFFVFLFVPAETYDFRLAHRLNKVDPEEAREKRILESLEQRAVIGTDASGNILLGEKQEHDEENPFPREPQSSSVVNRDNTEVGAMKDEDEDDGDLQITCCSICMEPYRVGDTAAWNKHNQDTCLHVFHFECFQEWLIRHKDCPSCRTVVLKRKPPSAAFADAAAEAEKERPKPLFDTDGIVTINENGLLSQGPSHDDNDSNDDNDDNDVPERDTPSDELSALVEGCTERGASLFTNSSTCDDAPFFLESLGVRSQEESKEASLSDCSELHHDHLSADLSSDLQTLQPRGFGVRSQEESKEASLSDSSELHHDHLSADLPSDLQTQQPSSLGEPPKALFVIATSMGKTPASTTLSLVVPDDVVEQCTVLPIHSHHFRTHSAVMTKACVQALGGFDNDEDLEAGVPDTISRSLSWPRFGPDERSDANSTRNSLHLLRHT